MPPNIYVPGHRMDLEDADSTLRTLEEMQCAGRNKPVVMLNAGKNREFNGSAGLRIAERIQELMDAGCSAEFVARFDDEEIWKDRVPELRQMTMAQRLEMLQGATHGQILDALPYLHELELQAERMQGVNFRVLGQPLGTSYLEQHWAVSPPHPQLALAENPTHIVTPASCLPLQQRMALAAEDAVLSGGYSESLGHVALLRHADINVADEARSLKIAKVLRRVGRKRYAQMCMGEGTAGKLYKWLQDRKLARTQQISTNDSENE